jgi:hypothetical protein
MGSVVAETMHHVARMPRAIGIRHPSCGHLIEIFRGFEPGDLLELSS